MFSLRNLRSISALTAIAAAVLAGCTTPTPPAQHEMLPLALGQTTLPPGWKHELTPGQFDAETLGFALDPELKALIAEAQQRNVDLRIAAARVEQSRAALKATSGTLMPSVGIGLQAGESALPSSSMSTTGIALIANWEIDIWGRARSETGAADARLQSAELDTRYAREAIAAAVVRAWLATNEASQQLDLTKQMVDLAGKQAELIKSGLRVGRNTEQDVSLSEANLATYRNQQAVNELTLNQSKRALEVLLGRYPSAEIGTATTLPAATAALPAGLPTDLMNRRPDLLAAEQRFRAAFYDVEAAQRARLPSLKLVGGVGYIEDSVVQLKEGLNNPLWSLTGQLLAPIFTGGQLEAAVEVKNAKQQEAVASYAKTALTALNEVEGALANDKALALRQQAINTQVEHLQKSVKYAEVQVRVGRGDVYQLQQQQLSLAAAQANLLRLQGERLSNRVALHQALGGHFPS